MWTLKQATRFLRDEYRTAEEAGWMLALVGSVPRDGKGNDLDIVAFRETCSATPLWECWDERWTVLHADDDYLGQVERTYELPDGRTVDVWFRPGKA